MKNEKALELIQQAVSQNHLQIKCVDCDAAFGSDYTFQRRLPEGMCYFASIKETEPIFLERPTMTVPDTPKKNGRPFKHPRPDKQPVKVKGIALVESFPWVRKQLAKGAKGPIYTAVKCLKGVACKSTTQYGNYLAPEEDVWLYFRKDDDGKLKYFLSNAPMDTELETLDQLASHRWSIEHCFQERKNYLGMSHYETRTYTAWHRHMLCVMIAHLRTTIFRLDYKKTIFDDAYD